MSVLSLKDLIMFSQLVPFPETNIAMFVMEVIFFRVMK